MFPKIYEPSRIDEIIKVNDEQAYNTTRWLALTQGVFVGMSAGAAVYGAVQVSKSMNSGTIVCILPDRGDRYLRTYSVQVNMRQMSAIKIVKEAKREFDPKRIRSILQE